jgi:hypothetical protein
VCLQQQRQQQQQQQEQQGQWLELVWHTIAHAATCRALISWHQASAG